jgi:hypothetical protein
MYNTALSYDVPILCLVVRPSLHGHYLSVRLQLLLSFCGFVGMMIATDVYFLQFHSCVVCLRVLFVVLCQRPLRTTRYSIGTTSILLCHINDLPECVKSQVRLFADDEV